MTSPTKAPVRSNAHTFGRFPRIGLGYIFGNNQFRGNHMLDMSRKGTSLLDGKDESEQSGGYQLRRMQMVAIGVRDIAGFDGFALFLRKQVSVRQDWSSKPIHPRVPVEAYRAASVNIDCQLLPSVDNGEGA